MKEIYDGSELSDIEWEHILVTILCKTLRISNSFTAEYTTNVMSKHVKTRDAKLVIRKHIIERIEYKYQHNCINLDMGIG